MQNGFFWRWYVRGRKNGGLWQLDGITADQPVSQRLLFLDKTGFHWLYMHQDGMAVPEEFDLIDFRGGLYAVATGIDQQTDREVMEREPELGNIITSPRAKAVMGYEQMDYYTPVEGRK